MPADDDDPVVSFVDEDGEQAFFLASDISLPRVPLSAVEPRLADALGEDYLDNAECEAEPSAFPN